ncbi:hypothetical protein AB1Y20_014168 [Prymnesium parvum]|uniref:Major facilitator superfamily (MFS) profile domain-containing protein n=1 Tax=Prymnesium parvum TaxID=97485 RepID=A0AB34IE77_PRYPA
MASPLACTLAYCVLFVGLGLMPGIVGPTLPALSNLTAVAGPSDLVPMYVARGACYGLGTTAMGALLDRTGERVHTVLVGWQLVMAGTGALFPHASTLWTLVLLAAAMNFAAGCVDVMGNVLLVQLWENDDARGAPAMNLLHAAWSSGSTLGPLLARAVGLSPGDLPRLYLVAAIATAVLSLPLLGVSPLRRSSPLLGSQDGSSAPPRRHSTTSVSLARFSCVVLLMFCFYMCLGAAERIPGDWLTTAIVRSPYLHEDERGGAFVTSVFFGAHLCGRVLSVPLAWCLRPVTFCAIEFTLAITSAIAFVAFAPRNYAWLLVSSAGIGLGISALYPQGLLLAKSRVHLSSVWISRLVVGALAGAVLGPPATGDELHLSLLDC